eukprot:CAMPEP_0117746542 /NCGR_PEP_ID=MMETSP0947-20121206/8005_1 /TAXON_ID=44440 /ORGANISM="Chattonella subsalsa, Strain CCMP2191" /LENGTH=229 /DNA_ID=CAMNT_0005563879 /DNA_START=78 /DNA_END=767 /DNA_ORIENTATION=+
MIQILIFSLFIVLCTSFVPYDKQQPLQSYWYAHSAHCDNIVENYKYKLRPVYHGRYYPKTLHENKSGFIENQPLAEESSGQQIKKEEFEELATLPTLPKFAPPMTEQKFATMQDRRVSMYFRYTGGVGLKLYYLFAAKHFKQDFPELKISRKVLPCRNDKDRLETTFEIHIDHKLVYQKRPEKKAVYLELSTIEEAIVKARREKRPNTVVYGDPSTYQKSNNETEKQEE